MPIITPPIRALPIRPLFIALRTALVANGTITGLVGTHVYRNFDPSNIPAGTAFPLIVVTLPSGVPNIDYTNSRLSALFDIIAVDQGNDATNIDALVLAIQTAIIDTPWTITGYTLIEKAVEAGPRTYADVQNAVTHQYAALSIRVIAELQ